MSPFSLLASQAIPPPQLSPRQHRCLVTSPNPDANPDARSFVVLGIGADDVFVYCDTFKQSLFEEEHSSSLRHRIIFTTHRSSKAIFVTSFTTMAAFLATATSKLMPVASFGIFAAVTILFLYLENIFIMPPLLVIHSRYLEHLPVCVPSAACLLPGPRRRAVEKRRAADDLAREVSVAHHLPLHRDRTEALPPADAEEPMSQGRTDRGGSGKAKSDPRTASSDGSVASGDFVAELPVEGMRRTERFFHGPFLDFISRAKFVLLGVFGVILILGAVFTSQLSPPEEEEQWLPSNHILQEALDLNGVNGPFAASEEDATSELTMVWGIKGMKTSHLSFWQVRGGSGGTQRWDAVGLEGWVGGSFVGD